MQAWGEAIKNRMGRWSSLYNTVPYQNRRIIHIQILSDWPERDIVVARTLLMATCLCAWCLHHLPSHALPIFHFSNWSWDSPYLWLVFSSSRVKKVCDDFWKGYVLFNLNKNAFQNIKSWWCMYWLDMTKSDFEIF